MTAKKKALEGHAAICIYKALQLVLEHAQVGENMTYYYTANDSLSKKQDSALRITSLFPSNQEPS